MSDQDRALFLVVTIKPRLDRMEQAEAQLQSMRHETVKEPGCVFMHLVQPHDDPETWLMLEMFRSRTSCARRQNCASATRSRRRSGGPDRSVAAVR